MSPEMSVTALDDQTPLSVAIPPARAQMLFALIAPAVRSSPA